MSLILPLLQAEIDKAITLRYDSSAAKWSAGRISALLLAAQAEHEEDPKLLIYLEVARLASNLPSLGKSAQRFTKAKLAAFRDAIALLEQSHAPTT
jgi:hypothetical protein